MSHNKHSQERLFIHTSNAVLVVTSLCYYFNINRDPISNYNEEVFGDGVVSGHIAVSTLSNKNQALLWLYQSRDGNSTDLSRSGGTEHRYCVEVRGQSMGWEHDGRKTLSGVLRTSKFKRKVSFHGSPFLL